MFKIAFKYIGFRYRQHRRKTSEKLVVETVYGPVRGVKRISCWDDPYYSFERIPFAKPPVGELRFAVNSGNRKPVMVWVYGGGFEFGGATKVIYSPDYFMRKGVVFVTFNYRLAALGFLSLKDPALKVPGNAGLKDQIMALQWIKDNILQFGGDPENITVFGESAGGASTHFLMLTKRTKGLFQKAILMSGTAHMYWTIVPDHDWAFRLAQKIGYTGQHDDAKILDFLRKADGNAICRANTKLLTKEEKRNRLHFAHGPTVEPYETEQCVIPQNPRLMARDAWSNDIPLIVGGNSFEGLLLYPKVKQDPTVLKEIEDCEYLVPLELGLDRNSEQCKKLGLIIKKEFFGENEPNIFSYLNEPEPPEPWVKIKNCGREPPMPIQHNFIVRVSYGTEDCLYLNVYSPKIHTHDLKPVMVWIYGGGFEMGAASRLIYGPDYLIQKGVVLVTINYRVGPLGFLTLRDPKLKVPGNAGLKDQILALKWVNENIRNFGGDPNNVTLFGESAGGASAHYLMLTNQTKGLFHKAILMSGSALSPWAQVKSHESAFRVAKKLGYSEENNDEKVLHFLRKSRALSIASANGRLLTKEEKQNGAIFAHGPVVEPYETEQCVVPKDPVLMARDSWSNNIPVIMGGCADEGLIFYFVLKKLDIKEEVGDCEKIIPDCAKEANDKKFDSLALKEMYFGSKEPTVFPLLELLAHKNFWQPIRRTLFSRLAYAKAPTYLYRFAVDSDFNTMRKILCDTQKNGTCHGDDLLYLFFGLLTSPVENGSSEYKAIQRFVGMWTQFAKTGDPNISEIHPAVWKPASKADVPVKCLNISDDVTVIDLPDQKYLDVWDSFYPKDLLI